jgi:RNA polymerase sigma-70 factor (ECF subfamily)
LAAIEPLIVDGLSRADLEQRFDRLLAGNNSALVRLAASYTDTASDRDDLCQDIAMALWEALPRFRGECSERTFLFRIAHNRGIAHLSRRRLPRVDAEEEVEPRDPRPDPETGFSREQQGRRLMAAVQRLPVIYRQVITLTLEGMGYGEIAEVLGIGESNVGVRLTRARQLLQRYLEDGK